MAATYTPGSSAPLDLVRLLIPDRVVTPDEVLFQDEEISALLALNADAVRLATADALETIASDEALVQKVIHLGDLTTNGPAVSKELRERAASLRKQHAELGAGGSTPGSIEELFDIAETAWDWATAREIAAKQLLRGAELSNG